MTTRTETIRHMLADDADYLVGMDDFDAVLAEWVALDMNAGIIMAYMDAGCYTAESAGSLADVGVTPAQACATYGAPYPIGYRVANGDIDANAAAAIIFG